MNRRRNVLLSLLAAILSGLLVYGIGWMQTKEQERKGMVNVVVPNRFIGAGERLKLSDLSYKPVPGNMVTKEMLTRKETAEGMETLIPLGQGEPLYDWKVSRYTLQPGPAESTFQIPKSYIRSISNGIRAGDKVVLYLSGAEPRRLFEQTVKVASVKSSSNVEIDDKEDPNLLALADGDKEKMYASRRDANGMIDYINLNLTEEQWLEVDAACKDGTQQLVIAYSPETMQADGLGEENGP
ncbi:SAF domain-containing protein [Paenibacillus protaetiae]|uniref:Flagellar biosynthesis protein FlgA n=1 Tax=Paenibacillus protaetiae TaxID=2509456 RepID=A0A4P6EW71_9BACL|nr:SAF domain-containing protein [Paenibacillus protaetiae]QAY66835.1 flagellar biosynthesis protein FlgA [Paenibacillus protaetiae]